MAHQPKRLYRSRTDRMVAGVLGGVADYFGIDPTLVRLAYAIATFFTIGLPGVLLYLLMAIVVPTAPDTTGPDTEDAPID